MNPRPTFIHGRAVAWLLGLLLLCAIAPAMAQQQQQPQQDPPGRVGRLNDQQGSVSFSPAGESDWFEPSANRPLTTGDRLWTDRDARAELQVGATALRLDEQTGISISELDDDTARITVSQGRLQLRVREDLDGRRLEVDTANLAMVIDAPGDYRIEVDPADGTTRVAVAAGRATLFGDAGESVALGAQQQLTASGRNLAAVSGAAVRAGTGFDRWVAERDRLEEQSVSARYVSREVVGYQQLDAHGDWQTDPGYGNVWYPRNVDPEWAPYRDGQWVDVAPWGWTWVDAAPWGFAPAHYGRWARIGPRWGWVPGQHRARPLYSPALVGFVGGAAGGGANLALGSGRPGVGWFPLAPGEAWRPGYRASQRYVDEANRAAFQRQVAAAHQGGYANRQFPGAVTVVPTDVFGRGPIGRRDVVRLPADRFTGVPVGMGAPIPLREDRAGFGRRATPPPQAAMQMRQFEQIQQAQQAQQMQQARQVQQAQQQLLQQQRGVQAQAAQAQQMQQTRQAQQVQQVQQAQQMQLQQAQRIQQAQQAQQVQQAQQMQRQQQDVQQRAAQAQQMQVQQQMQQAQQQQQAQRQQIEAQQRAAQAQQQAQAQQMQRQQEMQQRAAQAQAQQVQAQQQMQQQRAQQMQLQAQQVQQAQQQMQQAQQAQQANAMRQAQEMQQRAAAQMQQQQQQQFRAIQQRAAQAQPQQPDRP